MINMILLPESQNTKTGNIIQSYSSPSSCPVSCPSRKEVAMRRIVVLTSIYPEADIAALKAKGIPAVQCLAQTKEITCKECRLCSRDREAVVIFEVHGNNKGKARRVIQIKRHS